VVGSLGESMSRAKMYRALVVLILLAILFGSSAFISIMAAEITFAIGVIMAIIIVILMFVKPRSK
jgi:hypothetical protein